MNALIQWDYVETIYHCLGHNPIFVLTYEFDHRKPNEWRINMAAKKDKRKDGSVGDWKGIANVPIDDSAKEMAQALVGSDDSEWTAGLGDLLASDYKLVIRWDDRSDCPMVSISCYDKDSPNYKHTLITRAPSWRLALALTWVKHHEIADGVWTEDTEGDVWS